jgi:hypothetical protein
MTRITLIALLLASLAGATGFDLLPLWSASPEPIPNEGCSAILLDSRDASHQGHRAALNRRASLALAR